ncbi:TIGR00730 family Rossman fold protein [Metabacillus sediminilitoris]|uniref:Cytokinin riboside 5'-monophosphate phosphoribohydrolase n=1 Tax=Metabacillus sediminilitoris TaxID=2567941 RepID=A0A4S4BL06_9BACI|nr:TIGR00730 family Rossman fold protein [Metabacillus sediminilitoris]QGQ44062.1 TIGR00730 family Rossman fold protein [Metabacillus sediminilitoris]THF75424.1 TIGR00730 family Rossman fold protein [Metabacillus sediminilitoris]
MKRVSVFCGSSPGANKIYSEEAEQLGAQLAKEDLTLVYGGATVGIMGTVANAALKEGGKVIGVIPEMLTGRENAHTGLSELIIVNSMHERKAQMEKLSDGFIVLPGGPGTMEEFFEMYTWAQLGEHQKPIGLLNINNYYDKLLTFFEHMIAEQFLKQEYRSLLIVEKDPKQLLNKFRNYVPPKLPKWISRKET